VVRIRCTNFCGVVANRLNQTPTMASLPVRGFRSNFFPPSPCFAAIDVHLALSLYGFSRRYSLSCTASNVSSRLLPCEPLGASN
jgi:hypothetical protein